MTIYDVIRALVFGGFRSEEEKMAAIAAVDEWEGGNSKTRAKKAAPAPAAPLPPAEPVAAVPPEEATPDAPPPLAEPAPLSEPIPPPEEPAPAGG